MRSIFQILFGKSNDKQDQTAIDVVIARQRNDRAGYELRATLDGMLARNDKLHDRPAKGKPQ